MSRADGPLASFALEIGAASARVTLGVFASEKGDKQLVELRTDPFEWCAFPNEGSSKQPQRCGVKQVRVHRGTEFEGVRGEKSSSGKWPE